MKKFGIKEWNSGFESYSLHDLKIADPDYSFGDHSEIHERNSIYIKDNDSESKQSDQVRINNFSKSIYYS